MNSIVDYLKSINKPSDFDSRKKMYEGQYGGTYTGSANQNMQMLKHILNSATKTPMAPYLPFTYMPAPRAMGMAADAMGMRGVGSGAPVPYRMMGQMFQSMAGKNNPYLQNTQQLPTPQEEAIEPVAGLENLLAMLPFMKMLKGAGGAANTLIKPNPARTGELGRAISDYRNPYMPPAPASMQMSTNRGMAQSEADNAMEIINRIRGMMEE